MTPNNNLSVLPFYLGEQYQDFRKSYAYGEIYPLFSPSNRLLPFQIIRPTSSVWNPTAVIRRVNKNGLIGSEVRNVTQTLLEGGLRLNRFSILDRYEVNGDFLDRETHRPMLTELLGTITEILDGYGL